MDMECPYCKSKNTFTYFTIENLPTILSACQANLLSKVRLLPFKADLCKDCLLGFNSAPLEEDEVKLIYDNYLYISPMSGIGQTKYGSILKTIKRHCSMEEKIVEIGCSEGYLLYQLQQHGYKDLTGIEPGPQSEIAKSNGLNVIEGYFETDTFVDESVDCFVMMHVFEHFRNPFSILESIKKQLSPVGKIIIEVPYFSGYYHQHLFFYNFSFLRKLCSDKNLKII
jgi:SAM-dependent methyltransferase